MREPSYKIEVASQDVENWMLANGVEELNGLALRSKLSLREQELAALRSLIVEELHEAGIWETFDGEELHTGNWIQGLRLLRRELTQSQAWVSEIFRFLDLPEGDMGALEDRAREFAQAKKDTARLDWMLTADAAQLNALDKWDRTNIDDAINREGCNHV